MLTEKKLYLGMRRAAIREATINRNASSTDLKLINGVIRPFIRPRIKADGTVIYED